MNLENEKVLNMSIPTTDKPTKVRWEVFIAILVLCTINYVDRAVLSVLMPAIQADLQFSPEMIGLILSAFFWGYLIMQIPSGWLCDKFSPGKVIVGTGLLWGIFQIITGFITSSTLFIGVRALLGMSEAPIYPSGGKLQSVWLTKTERGKGAALLDSGSAIGVAIGGPICALFMAFLDGWRGALIGAGILTIVIVLICKPLLADGPETSKRVNEAEREYLRKAFEEEDAQSLTGVHAEKLTFSQTIRKYITSRSFWGLCLGFASYDACWYGLMTWGALYLAATHNLDINSLGSAIFIIYAIGVVGSFVGGALTDKWRTASESTDKIMKRVFPILGIMVGVAMYFLSLADTIFGAVICISVAMFGLKWSATMFWSLPAMVADRQYTGSVSGAMNMIGNIAGAAIPVIVGLIVGITGSYYWALMLFVVIGIAMGLFPVMINYSKKIGVK